MININNLKKIHFVGIGGIGVSALAHFFLKNGIKITGSDLFSSEITDRLEKEGAYVHIGPHEKKNIDVSTDLVTYSPAVTAKNPEIMRAKSLKIPVYSYPEVLGELTKRYTAIAVSGTHGKSTTTSLIGLLLTAANLDPTVIVGAKLREFSDLNCRVGKSKFLVIEADEFAGSFLNYSPKIAVLTNVEKEHMDYFKNEHGIIKVYTKYLDTLRKNHGILVINLDTYRSRRSVSLYQKIVGSYIANGGKYVFYSLNMLGKNGFPTLRELRATLQIPGEHNISNACAALMAVKALGVSSYPIRKAWGTFTGAWRRFEILGPPITVLRYRNRRTVSESKSIFISDYGHHPTEIRATLQAARQKFGQKKKIICVYQPHQYQRTHYLFKEFVTAFDLSDTLILLDIYSVAGRERPALKKKVNSQKLASAIRNHILRLNRKKGEIRLSRTLYISSTDAAFNFLKNGENVKNSVVLIMGAGDIIKLVDRVKNEILK